MTAARDPVRLPLHLAGSAEASTFLRWRWAEGVDRSVAASAVATRQVRILKTNELKSAIVWSRWPINEPVQ